MSLFDPIDELFGVNGQDPGKAYQMKALEALQGIQEPSAQDLAYKLQQMVYQGDITPEQAQAIQQNPSLMQSVDAQGGRNAQYQALAQLQGIAGQGGMTQADLATLNETMGKEAQAARGSREAIIQNAKERGVAGSGTELMDQMLNAQESATRGNKTGLDIGKMAQERALQAIQAGGQLGGQIQGQEFSEAAQKAQAQDAINRFNTQNSQSTINANIAAKNEALARNAAERQRLADANTGLANDQAKAAAAAKQQAFDNATKKAGGVASGYQGIAEGQRAAEQSKRAFEGGLLGTAGTVAGGYFAGRKSSDETKKKDIKSVPDTDLDAFMASIDPKSFEYKDPNAPGAAPGPEVGAMAQDIEKTPVGKTMVKDTPDGKMLDMQKGFGIILAAIAALHDKMESEKGGAHA